MVNTIEVCKMDHLELTALIRLSKIDNRRGADLGYFQPNVGILKGVVVNTYRIVIAHQGKSTCNIKVGYLLSSGYLHIFEKQVSLDNRAFRPSGLYQAKSAAYKDSNPFYKLPIEIEFDFFKSNDTCLEKFSHREIGEKHVCRVAGD